MLADFYWASIKSRSYKTYNTIKAPHRYAVKGSDTTMLPLAASSPGHKFYNKFQLIWSVDAIRKFQLGHPDRPA